MAAAAEVGRAEAAKAALAAAAEETRSRLGLEPQGGL